MAGKTLISFSNSNSTLHLEGEIELAILPPVRRGEGSSGHHDGSAKLIEPRFSHSGSPFDRVLTFAEEDTKGASGFPYPWCANTHKIRDGSNTHHHSH
uniref:Uncharacterized protein n=1 Tax=Oryza nivara TaxID=4536 RepID=A0A0E0II83_ORYNI